MHYPLMVFLALALGAVGAPAAQSIQSSPPSTNPEASRPTTQRAQISGDPDQPRRHFRLRNAAEITPEDAAVAYAAVVDDMLDGYRLSGLPEATAYRGWRRFNTAPYASATHGQRYVNNYGNHKARAYGRFEEAGSLPVGAIIAKDSVTVTADDVVHPGPLFMMEKMPAGFSYVSGDWRYTMILPDGSVLGTTGGDGAKRVEFCIGCHLAREKFDHLFFVPQELRAAFE